MTRSTSTSPAPYPGDKPPGLRIPEEYRPVLLIGCLAVLGLLMSRYQKEFENVLLLEFVHSLVAGAILAACFVYQRRYPFIRQFGWNYIVWGIGLLFFGTLVDIIDNPPGYAVYWGLEKIFPFKATWETAFYKKMIGYASGISLFAYGFFQWIPWMIETRLSVQRLNDQLSENNRNLNRTLMSLDDHVESERVKIARELHDDVAQQLTFVNVQVQLCQRELSGTQRSGGAPSGEGAMPEATPAEQASAGAAARAGAKLVEIAASVSEALRSVRRISSDLRPEALFSLGLIPALEQFIEKARQQNPQYQIRLDFSPLAPGETHTQFEKQADDSQRLHAYRVLQEGIRNALKHAGCGEIRVRLEDLDDGRLRILIEDDGKGLPWAEMPPDETLIRQGRLGLVGMKERVRELSGRFTLTNRPDGKGTRLEIQI